MTALGIVPYHMLESKEYAAVFVLTADGLDEKTLRPIIILNNSHMSSNILKAFSMYTRMAGRALHIR